MKGLIIKDLMCLRKQRVTFCFTVLSVIVISVMFVLSAKFGNIASANQEMMAAKSWQRCPRIRIILLKGNP